MSKGKQPVLDLHGFKTDDVEEKVDQFLHLHNSKGTPSIKIMTGKGTGAVRQLVIKYLKQGNYPWSYEKLPNGTNNEGVLIVHLE